MSSSDWRPDPSLGIFETVLVVDGSPIELNRHLDRLAHSLDAVYSLELSPDIEEELLQAASGITLGRLRLTVAPGKDRPRHDLLAGGVVPGAVFPERGARLQTHQVKGGRGPHKWVDRRGMEHPSDGAGQLIRDGDELLEAGWANLFAVREETLWTPPLDGRILAGTARATVFQIADEEGVEVEERMLRTQDLLAADETFLTNSIRGVEPATALDDAQLPGLGPLSRRLADALRRRWALPDPAAHKAAAAAPKQNQLSH